MKKLKIFFNEPPTTGPYGGASQFVENFSKFLKDKGHEVIYQLERGIDLIIIVSNSTYLYKEKTKKLLRHKKKNKNVKILHRINNCDKRKNTSVIDKLIFKSNKVAEVTVFVSEWLAQYFIKQGFNKNYKVIYNGSNPNYFYPKNEKKELGKKIRLVTHHWSSHWMKGFDIYNEVDNLLDKRNDLSFTYIGNYIKTYKPNNIKIIPPLSGIDLGNYLRKFDIYLTASRWEPGGHHYTEGARCGLPVLFHKEGGGVNELCKNFGVEYQDIPSLLEGIQKIKKSYNEFLRKIPYDFLSSKRCNEEYYQIIQNIF